MGARINRFQEGGERNEGMSGVTRYEYKKEERKERSSYKENYERTRKKLFFVYIDICNKKVILYF